jgi:hypothetical protein
VFGSIGLRIAISRQSHIGHSPFFANALLDKFPTNGIIVPGENATRQKNPNSAKLQDSKKNNEALES